MKKNDNQLSVTDLQRLLVTIAEHGRGVCFRYRLMGEMWYPNFVRILKVTEKGVLLNDESRNTIISVPDLSAVIQFEIDSSLHNFEPHFHYQVIAREF